MQAARRTYQVSLLDLWYRLGVESSPFMNIEPSGSGFPAEILNHPDVELALGQDLPSFVIGTHPPTVSLMTG